MAQSEVGLVQGCLEPGLRLDDIVCVAVLDVREAPRWEEPVVVLPVAVLAPVDVDAVQRQRDLRTHGQILAWRLDPGAGEDDPCPRQSLRSGPLRRLAVFRS
jgi:hypothetical protein